MRQTRREASDGQNLDSLLDTMANVVGILIVLMAVTQLTVNDAMDRIRVWESEEAAGLREATQDARDRLAGMGSIELARSLELGKVRDLVRMLRDQPEAVTAKDTTTLTTDLASQRMQAQRLEGSIREQEERLARLEILVAEAETRSREATQTVRLPDPRPAPPTAEEVKIFCRYGRVFDPRFQQLTSELLAVRRQTRSPVSRYLDTHDVGNELLRWRMAEDSRIPAMRLEWRHTSIGETASELQARNAQFRKRLASYDPGSRFLHFYVWEDSFEVYLEARQLAEQAGFAAGWQPLAEGRPLDFVQGPSTPTPVD